MTKTDNIPQLTFLAGTGYLWLVSLKSIVLAFITVDLIYKTKHKQVTVVFLKLEPSKNPSVYP